MSRGAPTRFARAMRYVSVLAVAVLVGIVGFTEAAYANFPHFRTFSVSLTDTTLTGIAAADSGAEIAARASVASTELPDLLYTWTEVGVGQPDVVYLLQSEVTATFGCVNAASKLPQAGNKITVAAPLATEATLTSDRNGKISGSVVVDTSSVSPTGFSCPSGQTLVAISATFAQNTITDTTNGVTATDDDIVVTLFP
jgi:hypothetical protein